MVSLRICQFNHSKNIKKIHNSGDHNGIPSFQVSIPFASEATTLKCPEQGCAAKMAELQKDLGDTKEELTMLSLGTKGEWMSLEFS